MQNLKSKIRHHRYRGFVALRLAMVLTALFGLLELGAAAASRVFDAPVQGSELIYPSNTPFKMMKVGLSEIGPERALPAVQRLLLAAEKMARFTSVPYVYGGSRIGTPKQCQQCVDCTQKLKLSASSGSARFNKCSACRLCGIDCSNFVNRLFAEAGLRYRFADTRTFNASGEEFLQEQLGFINIGRNLLDARPGDLILQKGHVMMVVAVDASLGTIDYIHSSRGSRSRKPIGGIELRRGKPLDQVQKEVIKILRHRDLVEPGDSEIIVGENVPTIQVLLGGMRKLVAANQ